MKELVTRPPADKRKIHSKNEFELCYLRHQYLRRVDYNPTALEMKPYMPIVERMSRNTFTTYRYLFGTIGMMKEDIVNTGRVYLTEFIGLFEFSDSKNRKEYESFCIAYMNRNNDQMPGPSDVRDGNMALFTMFMKQRMEDLVRICRQKAKNIKGLKVDEYVAFYGPNPPPENIYLLLEDNQAHGFKILDGVAFKAIKKKCKAEIEEPFQFAGSWYVAVRIEQRNLTILDLVGAGLDPYESRHNMNPEKILQDKETEIRFDKNARIFKNSTSDEKAKTIFDFIEKNEGNPTFEEEIAIAKKYLRNLGPEYVR
jgi:hypothetical protein